MVKSPRGAIQKIGRRWHGHTVVLKPAPNTRSKTHPSGPADRGEADLPAGGIKSSPLGPVRRRGISRYREGRTCISVTGSTASACGSWRRARTTMKRLFLELGRKYSDDRLWTTRIRPLGCLIGHRRLPERGPSGCAMPTRMLCRDRATTRAIESIKESMGRRGETRRDVPRCAAGSSPSAQRSRIRAISRGSRRRRADGRRRAAAPEGWTKVFVSQPFRGVDNSHDRRPRRDLRAGARRHSFDARRRTRYVSQTTVLRAGRQRHGATLDQAVAVAKRLRAGFIGHQRAQRATGAGGPPPFGAAKGPAGSTPERQSPVRPVHRREIVLTAFDGACARRYSA